MEELAEVCSGSITRSSALRRPMLREAVSQFGLSLESSFDALESAVQVDIEKLTTELQETAANELKINRDELTKSVSQLEYRLKWDMEKFSNLVSEKVAALESRMEKETEKLQFRLENLTQTFESRVKKLKSVVVKPSVQNVQVQTEVVVEENVAVEETKEQSEEPSLTFESRVKKPESLVVEPSVQNVQVEMEVVIEAVEETKEQAEEPSKVLENKAPLKKPSLKRKAPETKPYLKKMKRGKYNERKSYDKIVRGENTKTKRDIFMCTICGGLRDNKRSFRHHYTESGCVAGNVPQSLASGHWYPEYKAQKDNAVRCRMQDHDPLYRVRLYWDFIKKYERLVLKGTRKPLTFESRAA